MTNHETNSQPNEAPQEQEWVPEGLKPSLVERRTSEDGQIIDSSYDDGSRETVAYAGANVVRVRSFADGRNSSETFDFEGRLKHRMTNYPDHTSFFESDGRIVKIDAAGNIYELDDDEEERLLVRGDEKMPLTSLADEAAVAMFQSELIEDGRPPIPLEYYIDN